MADTDLIGVCLDCSSDQPMQYAEKQVKLFGFNFPCRFCGGVVNVIRRDQRQAFLDFKNASQANGVL